MSLVAHAITAAPAGPIAAPGLRDRALAVAEAAGLAMWSTPLGGTEAFERADVLDHHRIVERICAAQPCLPVRFGTTFADESLARASLEKRAAQLRESLGRVSGKTELALTLLWRDSGGSDPALVPGAGPGRRYLEERRAEYADREMRRRRAHELVERIVADLAIDRSLVWHDTCTSAAVAVSLAALVPAAEAQARKAQLARIGAGFADVTAVVNGPWPPYTFAGTE